MVTIRVGRQGYGYPAVFSTFARETGLDERTALGVAGGFGAGLGRQQGLYEKVCQKVVSDAVRILEDLQG